MACLALRRLGARETPARRACQRQRAATARRGCATRNWYDERGDFVPTSLGLRGRDRRLHEGLPADRRDRRSRAADRRNRRRRAGRPPRRARASSPGTLLRRPGAAVARVAERRRPGQLGRAAARAGADLGQVRGSRRQHGLRDGAIRRRLDDLQRGRSRRRVAAGGQDGRPRRTAQHGQRRAQGNPARSRGAVGARPPTRAAPRATRRRYRDASRWQHLEATVDGGLPGGRRRAEGAQGWRWSAPSLAREVSATLKGSSPVRSSNNTAPSA